MLIIELNKLHNLEKIYVSKEIYLKTIQIEIEKKIKERKNLKN